MKRIASLLLIFCLLLTGCTHAPAEPSTQPPPQPTQQTTAPTTEPVTEPTTEPTEAPTEPPVLYRNPLNGQPMDAPATLRPYAIVLNNIRFAQPQHGVSQADMVFEILAEGGITRCLGLFSDPSAVDKIGSIRSARTYLIDLARGHDAILVHAGSSSFAQEQFSTVDHLDGLYDGSAVCFYRDPDRLNAGYSAEHTLFITGARLISYAQSKRLTLTRSEGVEYPYTFADEVTLDGESAKRVTATFRGGKTTTMLYNPATGLYAGEQTFVDTTTGTVYIDGNTDSAVTFRNVLVLQAKMSYASDGLHVFHQLTGSGNGYFACGGRIVPILWTRDSKTDAFVYTFTDGTPITLGTGASYIAIIPTTNSVSYS